MEGVIDPHEEFEYVVILHKTTGEMRFKYAMVDKENNTLAPLLNKVVWPRLFDTVDFRACVLKNILYIVGGRDLSTGKCLKQVLKYDPELSRWRECASLKKARARHTVCALNGKLYAMGGLSCKNEILDTVETYEPILDEWKEMDEKMPGARKDHACITHENKIILCGGSSPTMNATDTIWQMKRLMPDPHKLEFVNVWEENVERSLNNNLSNLMAVNISDRLYVLGGVCHGSTCDGKTFLQESDVIKNIQITDGNPMEKQPKPLLATSKKLDSYKLYQPLACEDIIEEDIPKVKYEKGKGKAGEQHTNKEHSVQAPRRKPWGRSRADMITARCCAGTVLIGHKLFVIGGYKAEDEERSSCNTVDYYHVKNRHWKEYFSLGDGNYSEVDCVVLKGTRRNKDFRPMRYSNCKWVLW